METKLSSARRKGFAAQIVSWYSKHKRDLPWRRDAHDPYRVWVSETLLQQTQVTTVMPYYGRFLKRFPTLRALATAPLDDVLKTWEGAGYYARARNMHRAAQDIVARFSGKIPETVEDLLTLPGIGRYTAGAIASIAFNHAAPVLDGNVTRVLCRYFDIRGDPKSGSTRRELWSLAEALLPRGRADKFNQGLMDLGATICTPHSPDCVACPIRRGCAGRRLGIQEQLPAKPKQKPLPHHQIAVGVIWKRGKVLIAKRFAKDLLGGLWEFPGGHQEPGESLAECVEREIREEVALDVQVGNEFAAVDHGYSHFSITLHSFHCRWIRGRPRAIGCADCKWVTPHDLVRFAFPAANRKIFPQLLSK